MNQQDIISYCNELLNITGIPDFCPNGLQVEAEKQPIKKIALGVSISLEFIESAIAENADMIITHHGLIWDKDNRVIQGPFRKKIKLLLDHNLTAAAYHLPLDFHSEVGNNIQLAKRLGLTNICEFDEKASYSDGIIGETVITNIDDFSAHIGKILERTPVVLPYGKKAISKVVIITGGAQGYFQKAIDMGADCFITGEISEKNFTMSKEYAVHFISAGHYATEKYGIQALGDLITDKFAIECCFIDIPNPI